MPQKTWVVGEEVLATDFNTYVQKQVVPTFASVAARDATYNAATAGVGATCTTVDTGTMWIVIPGPTWLAVPTPTPWIGFTFQNGWSNYLSGMETCAIRKLGDNVQLRGTCSGGTVGGGTPIFTIPAGSRPTGDKWFPAAGNGLVGLVGAYADGRLVALAPMTNVLCSLNGISWSTTA
jgi:hypothetical protein